MPRDQLLNRAYILWLIRQAETVTWAALCKTLGLHPNDRFTAFGMVMASLGSLITAGLISSNRPLKEFFYSSEIDAHALTFSVTPLVAEMQQALQLSLADLAATDTHNRLIVAPTLNRVFSSRFRSDLLVLMPFAPELRPLYDDHLTAVANQLQMSIGRADDFFTAGHIMDEIWTAILSATIVIADCTGRNPNVFYEIGLAHAIGKQVILIAQNEDDVPFDLRHRRYITYQFTPRGMKEFEQTLTKVLEDTRDQLRASPRPTGL